MVYTKKVREITIYAKGYLEDLSEEEEAELMKAVSILRKIEDAGVMHVNLSQIDARTRIVSREYLALIEAIRQSWCIVSDFQDATDLSRELVIRHMTKITKQRPDLFEYTKTIPNPTKIRKGQAWRIKPGCLPAVQQIREQGRRDLGLEGGAGEILAANMSSQGLVAT